MASTRGLLPDSREELTSIMGVMETLEGCNHVTLGIDKHAPETGETEFRKVLRKKNRFCDEDL